MRGGTPRTYSVDELTGFGFQDSTTFAPKTVQLEGKPQRLFVEIIGDSTFFYLQRDKAFFKTTKTVEQINKKDLLPYLQSLTSASAKWNSDLHLFRLKRNSLRYFAGNNAAGKTPTVLFVSGGLFTSFNRSTLSTEITLLNKGQSGPVAATSANISAGIFADLPIWPVNNLSLHAQGNYGKMRFNETRTFPDTRYDFKVDLDFARLSLMPQYTLSFSKLRLFAQAGPSVLCFLKTDSQALETITEGDNIWPALVKGVPVSKGFMFGLEAGAGIGFFYLPKHYFSLSISQANSFGKHFNISNQSVTVSTNL
ncbi:hypothetical protein DXT99_00320 [Pontibacter diazotrophicus]|uniref:Outer membrane protein beta-barrel domain-containing protein n=2 Tax=Pontibacter diazotrophicus TaxID=1400979 RepID=A0A3D8LHS1_9BACT|nr:hypothetical protein DXT99_00320 [Pontibacter diazotrophicus]